MPLVRNVTQLFGIRNRTVAGIILFSGAVQFNIFLLVAQALTSGYSLVNDDISFLGNASLSPAFLIFNTSVVVAGLALVVSGILVFRAEKSTTSAVISVLMIILGLGVAGVGAFPSGNPYGLGYNPHNEFATVAFLFSGIAAIASYRLQKGLFSYFSVLLGVVTLVMIVPATYRLELGIGLAEGLRERLVLYPAFIWAILFGIYLARTNSARVISAQSNVAPESSYQRIESSVAIMWPPKPTAQRSVG